MNVLILIRNLLSELIEFVQLPVTHEQSKQLIENRRRNFSMRKHGLSTFVALLRSSEGNKELILREFTRSIKKIGIIWSNVEPCTREEKKEISMIYFDILSRLTNEIATNNTRYLSHSV